MKKVNSRPVLATVFVAVFSLLVAAGLWAMDDLVFEDPGSADFDSADAAFGVNPAAGGASSAYDSADAAFADDPITVPVNPAGEVKADDHGFGSFSKTNMASIPASVAATMTYEQYEAYRRSKAEAYALTDASYGTAEFIPTRQEALERVIQQAKDMQFSQEMIDELAKIFRLVDYIDYDYNVKYGKNPNNYLRHLEKLRRERLRRERAQRMFNDRLKRNQLRYSDEGGGVNPDGPDAGFTGGDSGITVDGKNKLYFGPGSPGYQEYLDAQKLKLELGKYAGAAGAQEIPDDVVSSIEAAVHNAILDKLKAKGYDVAALNVFLQNLSEIKVIAIITTSELPKSAIRGALRTVRSIIENEVLAVKFKALRLAQLSSFTLLNEVDNTFYEHPVLYWQMQLTGWDTKGRRVSPGTPAMGDIMPQADSNPEADTLLEEFMGN